MHPRQGLFSGLVCLAALGALLTAGFLGLAEWRAIKFLAQSDEDRLRHLATAPVTFPPSIRTGRDVLLACEGVLLGDLFPFQPATVQTSINARCSDLARDAIARSPDWSLAHYAAALTHHIDKQPEARNLALSRSQALAPFEAWLAARRFDLARSNLQNNGLDGVFEADIAVLLDSASGRTQIVSAYLNDATLRAQVKTIEAVNETD